MEWKENEREKVWMKSFAAPHFFPMFTCSHHRRNIINLPLAPFLSIKNDSKFIHHSRSGLCWIIPEWRQRWWNIVKHIAYHYRRSSQNVINWISRWLNTRRCSLSSRLITCFTILWTCRFVSETNSIKRNESGKQATMKTVNKPIAGGCLLCTDFCLNILCIYLIIIGWKEIGKFAFTQAHRESPARDTRKYTALNWNFRRTFFQFNHKAAARRTTFPERVRDKTMIYDF